MDCDSSEDTAELQQQPAWVRICADEYAAVVSTAKISAAHPASLLASLIDLELSSQQLDPCVRLDCSADVAKVRRSSTVLQRWPCTSTSSNKCF